MQVELLVRWTEMRQKLMSDDEAKLKRLLNGDEGDEDGSAMGPVEVVHHYSRETIDLNDIVRFNESMEKGFTTVRYTDGDANVVKIDYEKFKAYYESKMGTKIDSLVPKDYKSKPIIAKKSKGAEDKDSHLDVPGFDDFDDDFDI